jgi:hypothetical protein
MPVPDRLTIIGKHLMGSIATKRKGGARKIDLEKGLQLRR